MSKKFFSSSDKLFSVLIESQHIDRIKAFSSKNRKVEVGGVIIGKYNNSLNCALVKKIDEPPSDSKSGSAWFVRGVSGLKENLRKLWDKERLFYIGEWHYHPLSSPEPSSVDHENMKLLQNDEKTQCKNPILIILGGDPTDLNNTLLTATVYKDGKPIPLTETKKGNL